MENDINKKYALKCEILTPTFIGTGSEHKWAEGVDYIIKDNILYHLSFKNLIKQWDESQLLSTIKNRGLQSLIGNDYQKFADQIFNGINTSAPEVNLMIKNQLYNQAIIPGSSIKGAIRSIILKYLLTGNKLEKNSINTYFGSINDGNNLMRFIKFPDISFNKTEIINSKTFNLYSNGDKSVGGWKGKDKTTSEFNPSGFNFLYETLVPNNKSFVDLMISEKLFNIVTDKQRTSSNKLLISKIELINKNIIFLFDIINKHTREYLVKEKEFFNKYQTDNTDLIIDNINNLLERLDNSKNNSCILKIGSGSGFHSITGDWQFDDYSIQKIMSSPNKRSIAKSTNKFNEFEKSPKSRKIAIRNNELFLMGFIELTILNENEANSLKTVINKSKLDILKIKVADIKAEEENKRKQEEDILLKKQNYEKFLQLIEGAVQYLDKKNPKKANELILEAERLCPDKTIDSNLRDNIKVALDSIQNAENADIQRENTAMLEASEKEKSLQMRIDNVNELQMLCGRVKGFCRDNNIVKLSEDDLALLINHIKGVFKDLDKNQKKPWINLKKWKTLSDILGESTINLIIGEITK